MVRAVERAHQIGATALQIFADNPTAWRRRAEPPHELPAFRERLVALDIWPVAIHAPYLVNLAGTDEDFFGRSVSVLADGPAGCPGVCGAIHEHPHRIASGFNRGSGHGEIGTRARPCPC